MILGFLALVVSQEDGTVHGVSSMNYTFKILILHEKSEIIILLSQVWIGTKETWYWYKFCFSAEGIRNKLLSATADDGTRWGDYAKQTSIEYIQKLIDNGE